MSNQDDNTIKLKANKSCANETVDDILEKIGGFGLYQKWIFILTCYPYLLTGLFGLNQVFILGVPEHRCAIPGYDNDTYKVQGEDHQRLIDVIIPPSTDTDRLYDKCQIFQYKNASAALQWYGRKPVMYFSGIMMIGSSICLSWVTEFWLFCVLQFIIGTSILATFMPGYVISLELTSPTKRFWPGFVSNYPYSIGLLILTGIAYGCRDWFYIQLYTSLPGIILITYWWLIPESPRWLLSKGRFDEAEQVIRSVAKWNKAETPSGYLLEKIVINDKRTNANFVHLFQHRKMCKVTLNIFFNWFAVSIAYFGLALNSYNLGLDLYLNFGLSGSVEFPAYILSTYIAERFGRRTPYSLMMIIGGIGCVSTVFTLKYASEDLQVITLVLGLLGRFCNVAAFSILYIHTAEIFPTVLRNAGLGGGSMVARIGSMTAPYIVTLGETIDGALPLIVFGVVSLISGITSLWLPETLGRDLPETIDDVVNFRRVKRTCEDDINNSSNQTDYEEKTQV